MLYVSDESIVNIINVEFSLQNRYFKLAKNTLLSWSGLWVLAVLLTTDALNTSLSILNCPSLSDADGSKAPVSKSDIMMQL